MTDSEAELDARIAINKQKRINDLQATPRHFHLMILILRVCLVLPVLFYSLGNSTLLLFIWVIAITACIGSALEILNKRLNNIVTLLIEEKVIK